MSLYDNPKKKGEEDFLRDVPLTRCPFINNTSKKQWKRGWSEAFYILILEPWRQKNKDEKTSS